MCLSLPLHQLQSPYQHTPSECNQVSAVFVHVGSELGYGMPSRRVELPNKHILIAAHAIGIHSMACNTSRAELDSASPCIAFAVLALGSKCTPAFRTSAMGAPRIQVHPLSFVLSIVPIGMTKAPLDSAAGDHMGMPGSVYFLHASVQDYPSIEQLHDEPLRSPIDWHCQVACLTCIAVCD